MFSVRFIDQLVDDLFEPCYRRTPGNKDIEFEIALPGVAKSHLKINVDKTSTGYVLSAAGKDHKDREFAKKILYVPEGYDVGKTKARLSDGLLTLNVPLKNGKRTEIKVE